jgi:hypothetical protein
VNRKLHSVKNPNYLNVSAFEKGFNEDYYDTGASNKYVLAPVLRSPTAPRAWSNTTIICCQEEILEALETKKKFQLSECLCF